MSIAMTLADELEGLPSFDYADAAISGPAFHAAMEALRAEGWLAKGPFGYIVLDHEAGEHFLRSRHATFPGLTIAELFGVPEGPLLEEMRRNILHLNGPDHARLRSLLNPSLSPRAVQRHRPALRALLERIFEQIVGQQDIGQQDIGQQDGGQQDIGHQDGGKRDGRQRDGRQREGAQPGAGAAGAGASSASRAIDCEAVAALARPYPAQAIATVMGAPIGDAGRLNDWSHWVQRQFDAQSMMLERERIEAAAAELYEYLEALLRERRRSPGDDLISKLLAAEEQGERLSEQECVNLVLNLLIGGVDTTQSQLAHTLRLLAERPEQWRLLRERPELAGAAVEEALRFEPVTPFTARIVEEEMTFRDLTFAKGTIVMVCAFTGNRSGAAKDGFDIAAQRPRSRVLTFGAGVHYCVGANLARAELEEALQLLAARVERIELAGEPLYGTIMGIYGLSELPLRLTLA